MKSLLLMVMFALIAVSACVVTPGPPGYGGAVVAPLPVVVELGIDNLYYRDGYYYFYQNRNWRYSKSRSGPWTDLPHSHWPKEIRYKERRGDGGNKRDRDGNRDDDRYRDRYDDRQRHDLR